MKKFYAILGSIFSIIGFVMFVTAQGVISSNTRYTWSRPYTQFEAQTLMIKYIGIILLICGIVDLALVVFSKIYTEKNVQDADSLQRTTVVCPNCGLPLNNSLKTCPKCKMSLK